jgi:hypothetical protein
VEIDRAVNIDWAPTCGFISFIPSAQVGALGGADMKAYLFRKLIQLARGADEQYRQATIANA